MTTCANCGNEVREGARFCASCGAPVVQAAAEPSRAEPPPPPSPGGKRRLRWVAIGVAVALLVAGGAVAATLSLTGGDDPTPAEIAEVLSEFTTTTETDLFGDTTDTTETDLYGDETDTTDTTGSIGQGVDETCKDIVAFEALAKEVDIVRGGNSTDDVEEIAAMASELASSAPAEAEAGLTYGSGEPRDGLQGMAEALGSYASLLSELGLEAGPDALLEPRIAEALSSLAFDESDVLQWFLVRCSEEDKAQLQQLGTPG